jgi:hypothetical protein
MVLPCGVAYLRVRHSTTEVEQYVPAPLLLQGQAGTRDLQEPECRRPDKRFVHR